LKQRSRRSSQDKITLQDVAERAGVSAITVSRSLRDPEKVSEGLREEILRIVNEMGYLPNLNARALASGNNALIGVLVPSLSHSAISSVVRGIEERVRGTEYRIHYANTHYDPNEEINQLRLFAAQRPAGIILAGAEDSDSVNALMREAGCPIVQTIDTRMDTPGMVVALDHRAASMVATRHMLEQGYRRFGLVGGGHDIRVRQRQAGYVEVMSDAGLYSESLIVWQDAPPSVHLGSHLLRRFIEARPDADGVVCHSDDLALGALFECQRLCIRVPEDFGICGFNDLDFAAVAEPPLTTVRIPRFEMGYRAADMIIDTGNGKELTEKIVDLGFNLVERRTTRRLRPAGSA
jgi:LacI family gluconate utilization system Gnt-I transcriptional repressor